MKWGDHQVSESDRALPLSNRTGYKLKQLFVSLNCCCYGHSLFTAITRVIQALSLKSKTPANDQEREQGLIEFLDYIFTESWPNPQIISKYLFTPGPTCRVPSGMFRVSTLYSTLQVYVGAYCSTSISESK